MDQECSRRKGLLEGLHGGGGFRRPEQRLWLAFEEFGQWCSDGAVVVNEETVGIRKT